MGTASTTAGVKRTASTRKPAAKTTAPSITTSAPLQESLDDKQQSESITAVSEDDRDDKSYFPGTSNFDSLALADDLDDEMVGDSHNWSTSFYGLSSTPFSADIANVLQQEIKAEDVEIKPDGLLYLPEIKYRRILNRAFGPGGWGLAPRGEHSISSKNISREYALVCHGRFVSQARGEQDFFDSAGLATAAEGCKSNALMRCCKDLGVASELWDPVFIRKFKKKYCVEVWTEHVTNKRKKKLWRKKDDTLEYPYKETGLA
ncbi:mitochondrial genome maintenance MGM101 [Hesseltinella vesiculosa]|uniref:Mitochondrial genome maintenance protein MGM101 n=1 Tax=Hesseltinella vesiculosa TaxID=101127 RepID=A0A1X2GPA5_9FUNG|nr:mitochondrial genome maintenance MGM101 [Hesseltinella vesiculosa]